MQNVLETEEHFASSLAENKMSKTSARKNCVIANFIQLLYYYLTCFGASYKKEVSTGGFNFNQYYVFKK